MAIPTKAAIHIQSIAPGPPVPTAVATPTIFPVPIVADKAVHSAAKLDISPSPLTWSSSLENKYLKASGSLVICKKPNFTVKYIPVPTKRINSGGPHTKLFIKFKIFYHIIFSKYQCICF